MTTARRTQPHAAELDDVLAAAVVVVVGTVVVVAGTVVVVVGAVVVVVDGTVVVVVAGTDVVVVVSCADALLANRPSMIGAEVIATTNTVASL